MVKWEIGISDLFVSQQSAGVLGALVRPGALLLVDGCSARRGAGLIEPAPFEGDTALAAVKDASRRCAVGLRPILDRVRARRPVDCQAGTKKRLTSRTKKHMIVSGSADRAESGSLLQLSRPGRIEQRP